MHPQLNLHVLFFAAVADQMDCESMPFEMPAGSCVRDLRQQLAQQHPQIANHLRTCRVARNEVFAAEDEELAQSDVLAIIPPVAGG